ncbi:MlaC/ttg2D family ABC transporter substrate-binding protein [Nitrincola tapanii]|uniref:ABC transporter substrate-binding protein n=1 Tax=Nitrincola tapanii TaxID=1708751 RepID=A0A5A9W1U4_9GAMM|nr:ABC transporter substrate-binding protein [Nitrincola tapanii]KAA0874065.1 ABC transporter substrate-binding protein [Nitrincola tapanii]
MTLKKSYFGWFLAGLVTLLSSQTQAADESWQAASQVVEQTTEKMLVLMDDKSLRATSNRERLQHEIESIVTPVIDFYGFGRGVMGRFARTATEEELTRFSDILKTTLVRTYSIAMSDFSVKEYRILPPRAPSPQPDMQVVNVVLTSGNNKTFNVMYYMRKVEGNWMLVNVMVEGINLRLTFQNQFADMYQRSRSIAAVIDNWEERVASTVAQVIEDVES